MLASAWWLWKTAKESPVLTGPLGGEVTKTPADERKARPGTAGPRALPPHFPFTPRRGPGARPRFSGLLEGSFGRLCPVRALLRLREREDDVVFAG